MNTEQERADFEAWLRIKPCGAAHDFAWEAWQARAALQSQDGEGWKEAFKAWQVCASIHREWARGRDAMFTTRQADFMKHAEDAFKNSMGTKALQSQDREDAERLQAMAAEWDRARRGGDSHMPIWYALCEAIGSDADGAGMREAIDRARRIEGDGA